MKNKFVILLLLTLLVVNVLGCKRTKTQAQEIVGIWVSATAGYGNMEFDKNGVFRMFDESTEIKGNYSLPANNKLTISMLNAEGQEQPSTFDITLEGNVFKIIFPEYMGQEQQPPMEFKRATSKDLAEFKNRKDEAEKAKEEATKNLDEGKKLSQENYAVFETSMGTIKIELLFDAAPRIVTNFINLINKGFYNNIIFHRVISDFMIQAGGLDAEGTPKNVDYKLNDEINAKSLGMTDEVIKQYTQEGFIYNDTLNSIKLDYGVIAMANAGPNTNGSQIFIITKKAGVNYYEDNKPRLIGRHTGFGKVISGMDIALKIEKVPTDQTEGSPSKDKPIANVVINKAYLELKK